MAYNTGTEPTLAELITAAFVPQVYSAKALMTYKSNLVSKGAFNTDYKDNLKKGHTVYIPVFSAASTTDVTPGTEPTAGDLANATPASITVNNWKESTAEISELSAIEEMADYLSGATEECSYSISKGIDYSVAYLFPTLNGASYANSDGDTFTDETFQSMVETLDEADVPGENRSLIGDPSMKIDLMNIDKFMRVDYVRTPVVPTGMFGTLYDAKVLITNDLRDVGTGNCGVYAHKDAIGLVVQKNPRVRVYNMGYKFIAKVIVDTAWGVSVIRNGNGVPFYTRKA